MTGPSLLFESTRVAYSLWGRWDARRLFERYARLSRLAGVRRLYVLPSLDCDTPDDARVVWDVHQRLQDMGVSPVYAVPGQLLQEREDVYRRIAKTGRVEFLNHGYRQHTYFDSTRQAYASCLFYHQLSPQALKQDIVQGHHALPQVLGVSSPLGFRTPHFGTFQRPSQLRFLHTILRELGYQFSASTMPLYGFRYGPMFSHLGVMEFPLSGMASEPLTVLDTWGCFQAPGRRFAPQDYEAQAVQVLEFLQKQGCGVLNYYADPLHIHDQEIFFRVVKRWCTAAVSTTYGGLLATLSELPHE